MIVDTHAHVVDPARFPVPEGAGYKPKPHERGTAEDLARTLADHGVDRCVIVPLSGYGTDPSSILDALAGQPGRFRATVALHPDTADRELDALAAAGVVGARFDVSNFGIGALAGRGRLLSAIGERGWVAHVQCPAGLLPDAAPFLSAARSPVVLDHLGLFDVSGGIDDPGFQRLLQLGRDGVFVKLSGGFRLSRKSFPHTDLDPFVAAIRAAFSPDRRIWGSDWPFVGVAEKPAYGDTLRLAHAWLPGEEERRLALGETPRRLFGLPP